MESKHTRYKRYDLEYKRRAVDLLKSSGRPITEIAHELGIPDKTLERWKYKLRAASAQVHSASDAQRSPEQLAAELQETRRKLAQAELERDILKKALAICSKDPLLS